MATRRTTTKKVTKSPATVSTENNLQAEDVKTMQYADPPIFFAPVEGGKLPQKMTAGAAGYDVYAREDSVIAGHELGHKVPLGFCWEPAEGLYGIVVMRSSYGVKTSLRMSNALGTIDNDYRGEVQMTFDNLSSRAYHIKKGERIGQLLIMQEPKHTFVPVKLEQIDTTARGKGGFGSTGND